MLDMCQSLSWPVLHGYSLESLGSCAAAAQTVWQRSKAQISRRPFKRNEEVFIVHFMLSMTHKLTCRYQQHTALTYTFQCKANPASYAVK